MREILFRGMDKNWNWYYGNLVECTGDNGHDENDLLYYIQNKKIPYKHNKVNPVTVGQYTGLKDRDGNKIFEGDILHDSDLECKVEYNQDGFYAVCDEAESIGYYRLVEYLDIWNLKVIGNIHEKKEQNEKRNQ